MADQLDSAHTLHIKVHKRDVAGHAGKYAKGFVSVVRFADNLHSVHRKNDFETVEEHGLVIYQ